MEAWNWLVKFLWTVPVAVLLVGGMSLLKVIPARLVMWLWEILLWLEMCPQHEAIVAVLRTEQG